MTGYDVVLAAGRVAGYLDARGDYEGTVIASIVSTDHAARAELSYADLRLLVEHVLKPASPTPPARHSDPGTSQEAGEAVRNREGAQDVIRPGTQKHRLLVAYRHYDSIAISDATAGDATGIKGAWKRCSDLRKGGFIHAVDTTVDQATGAKVTLSRITPKGREKLEELEQLEEAS